MIHVLSALALLAAGWMASYLAEALDQRPTAGMLKLAAVFGAGVELVAVLQSVMDWAAKWGNRLDRIIPGR